jgi:drug/metabolite transporter (DMT)-like permease
MNHTIRDGVLLALLAAACYAFFPIFTKLIYQYSSLVSLDIAGWRFMFAVPLLWALLMIRNRVIGNPYSTERLPRWQLMGLGGLLATGALAAFYGLSLIETGVYVMLFRTYPVIVLVIAVFLGDPLPERAWPALALVVVGVGMMILKPDEVEVQLSRTYLIGVLVAFYNAAVIAVYNVLQARVIAGRKSKAKASAWTITGAFAVLIPLMIAFGLAPIPNWQTLASLMGLALVSTVLPIIAIYEGISRIGASRFVLIGSVEPMLALLLAYILFGEALTPLQLLGGGLILASIILLEFPLAGQRRRVASGAGD